MPKENKHARGRRDQKKTKRKRLDQDNGSPRYKRRKSLEPDDEVQFLEADNAEKGFEDGWNSLPAQETPFFGLLTEEEQEYFRQADGLLESNNFPSPEERSIFLSNLYKEADGKELKIAHSQSCSRLVERLILLSTPAQKKNLFKKFSGHFLHMVQHRFASHCCEALFIRSAPVVTDEIVSEVGDGMEQEAGEDGTYVSMENLFLYTLNELEGHMGYLLTDRFASHVLRVLLIVLSGRPLAKSSTTSLLQSKKKEKIGIDGVRSGNAELSLEKRVVPESFDFAVEKIISDIVAGLDTTSIQVLATHPTGNPSLQLLLELEFTKENKKSSKGTHSVLSALLPDEISSPDSQSATLINGLLYDPIGSRLLETIISFAPGKTFRQIYRNNIRERICSLARNDIACFVVIKVLERLSKEDLEEVVKSIAPQVPGLIDRSHTAVIKTLLERSKVRNTENSIELLSRAIEDAYDPKMLLLGMIKMTPELLAGGPSGDNKIPPPNPAIVHGSLLAQTMLSMSGKPAELVQASILSQPPSILLTLACMTASSHILQTALLPAEKNLIFRKKLISLFLSPTSTDPSGDYHIKYLALSKTGSHVLDGLWNSTSDPSLLYIKERICAILCAHQTALRDDFVGRVVLRNWMVELFGRHRAAWIVKARESKSAKTPAKGATGENVKRAGPAKDGNGMRATGALGDFVSARGPGSRAREPKTAIELARKRFAAGKARHKLNRSRKVPEQSAK